MTGLHIRQAIVPEDIPAISGLWAQLGWGRDDAVGRRRAAQAHLTACARGALAG
jgi:hypothetical protein